MELMKNKEGEQIAQALDLSAAQTTSPLDRPIGAPIRPIPGLDRDVEAEVNQRVWGLRPTEFPSPKAGGPYITVAELEAREVYARGSFRNELTEDTKFLYLLYFWTPGFWLLRFFKDYSGFEMFSMSLWLLILLILTPFTLWRVVGLRPGLVKRSGARLALAWLLQIPLISAAFDGVALQIVLPFSYGGGLILLRSARKIPRAAPPPSP